MHPCLNQTIAQFTDTICLNCYLLNIHCFRSIQLMLNVKFHQFINILQKKKENNRPILSRGVLLRGRSLWLESSMHGPLTRYAKLRVAHAPRMPGTFPPPTVSDPDMTHVPWCMPGSLTSGFLWSRWRGKRSRHSRHMRNPQFVVTGTRPMGEILFKIFGINVLWED